MQKEKMLKNDSLSDLPTNLLEKMTEQVEFDLFNSPKKSSNNMSKKYN